MSVENEVAKPMTRNDRPKPRIPTTRMGLRPTRSERRPHAGAARNCAKAYAEVMTPMASAVASKRRDR